MPKQQQSRKRVASEEYDADGGFVEDAPKSKKAKSANVKASVSYNMKKDNDGNEYWDISGKRRLQISEFKGNWMVGIREFYEKDGEALPGRKGISLNIDQFNAFVELLPQIESVLEAKGIKVPRPKYEQAQDREQDQEQGQESSLEEAVEEVKVSDVGETRGEGDQGSLELESRSKSKLDKFRMRKPNHEATSDEDND